MAAQAIIDTNILVYGYDSSDPIKQAIAQKLLLSVWQREKEYALTIQILGEFFVTLTRKVKQPVSSQIVNGYIKDFLYFSGWSVFVPTQESFLCALELCQNTKIPFWDAQIAALAKIKNIDTIYTENERDFSESGLKVINPFKKI